MGFLRQEYWSGLSFPTPGDLSNPRIKSASPAALALQVDSLLAESSEKTKLNSIRFKNKI